MVEKVMGKLPDLLCAIDATGKIIFINEVCEEALGYTSAHLLGQNFLDFISPQDRARTQQTLQKALQDGTVKNFINHYIHQNGAHVAISWSAVWSQEENILYGVGRDASDQITASQKLQQKDEWHQVMVKHGYDMLSLLNEKGEYTYLGGSVGRTLGYTPDQLINLSVFELVHPDDMAATQRAWELLKTTEVVQVPDIRYKTAQGEWVWVEAIASNQLHNPAVNGVVISARDVTERKLATIRLEQSERRFRSLFDNNPDQVIYENREGIILDANPGFLNYLNLTKEEVVSRSLADILPPEVRQVCLAKLEEAFQGNVVNFDMEIPLPERHPLYLNVTKIPLSIDGEVVGAHSIAKDVTDVRLAHATIQKQAETLNTVFESIKDAFFMLDKSWRFRLINKECERVLGLVREECLGKPFLSLFPELAEESFYGQFHQAMRTGQALYLETFVKRFRRWFEVKAFPSEEGLSVYFTDTTERVKVQRELEKLSLVASKINNGVIITDAQHKVEWVNDALSHILGYSYEETMGMNPRQLLCGPEAEQESALAIEQKMQQGAPFNILFNAWRKDQKRVWVSVDFAPVLNEEGTILQHVAILKDITLRKEAEERQLQMTRDLYQQNRDLQQFTYIVSHNLRAPVANAMGLSDMLTKLDKQSAQYDTSLSYLKTSIFKLDTVLRDLNLILSVRDKQDVQDIETVSLNEVCEQVVQYFQESLSSHNGKVGINIDCDIEVRANRAYIYSIFYNLLSNAIKYKAEDRPLRISISCQTLAQGGARLLFTDNGSGFDMEKAGGNIFKLYKRFHVNKKGRGIGLFLVKTHVESMGGTIEMESKPNQGTSVSITLPEAVTLTK